MLGCGSVITPEDIEEFGCACGFDFADEDATDTLEAICAAVTDVLIKVSGYRYQPQCETTVYPCRDCCRCAPCGCCVFDAIPLQIPVVAIGDVTIDGETVEAQLYDGNMLVRTDGKRWPGCQDLSDPTFSVTYTWGYAASKLEFNAGLELACDLLASCVTRKPSISGGVVRQVSGQGISASVDKADIPFTEFPAVAKFAAFWNPGGEKVASLVYSPELDDGWSLHTIAT